LKPPNWPWLKLSANAAKFILVVKADRRGAIKIVLDDIAKTCGWSKSTMRRILKELADKNLISVKPATNQHPVTIITILDSTLSMDEQGSGISTRTEELPTLTTHEQADPADSALSTLTMDEQAADGSEDLALPMVEQGEPSIAQETKDSRRKEHFRILAAIAELIPSSGDVDGRARGVLSRQSIAAHAGLSFRAVARAVFHWNRWRVLCTCRREKGMLKVRFWRDAVEELLQARASQPRNVGALLKEYQARDRERLAVRAAVAV
jgi:hypothetical protein